MANSLVKAILLAIALPLAKGARFLGFARGVWLVCERPDEARDNGYHFFRFARTVEPDLRVYYVIGRDSPDLGRVSEFGQVIRWGSFRHYFYWCAAECLISAHAGRCAPEHHLSWRLLETRALSPKLVFLQHGVTAINCPDFMIRENARYDLIATAGAPEAQFLQESGGHPAGVPQLLGFCRFDTLHRQQPSERQILLMPTWRRWLTRLLDELPMTSARKEFLRSSYATSLLGLLRSSRLHSVLERLDWSLVFYPHYGTQPFLDLFEPTHPRIRIADRRHNDVQDLLIRSSVLLTDFSSVSFDFAYMGRPVIYVLPDEERYFSEHFQRGYFDFDDDAFGPVTRTAPDAVRALEGLLENGCAVSDEYRHRVDRFFPLRDDANCMRTLAAVRNVVGSRNLVPEE